MQLSVTRWRAIGVATVLASLSLAAAVSADLLSTVSSTRGVQVAPASDAALVVAAPQDVASDDLNSPFGVDELRSYLLTADLSLAAEEVEDLRDTLRSCARCLDITALSDSGGEGAAARDGLDGRRRRLLRRPRRG